MVGFADDGKRRLPFYPPRLVSGVVAIEDNCHVRCVGGATDRQTEATISCINDKWPAPAPAPQRKQQGHAFTHQSWREGSTVRGLISFTFLSFTVASIVGDAKQLQDIFLWSNMYFQKCISPLWQLLLLLAGIWKTRLFSSRQYSLVFLETSESVVAMVYVNFTTLCTGFSSGKKEHSAQFRPALRALCCWRSNCVGGQHVKHQSFKNPGTWRLPWWWGSMLLAFMQSGK